MGKKFSKGVSEIVTCKSKVVSKWEVEETGARFVCEDARLSMPHMGKEFQAIDLKLCNRDVPQIDADELDFVLDLAAAALDVEKHDAKTPSEKKIKWAFLESEGFKRARNALAGSKS